MTGQHSHLLPSCPRNLRYLESLAVELVQKIGRWATLITRELRKSTFYFSSYK